MAQLKDDRKRLLDSLAKVRARFSLAARAYEKDDHATSAEEVGKLIEEIDALLTDHFKTYPKALKEDRLSFLSEAREKIQEKEADDFTANDLLPILIHSEKALHVLKGEISRSYPAEKWGKKFWRNRKIISIIAVTILIAAPLIYWFTPNHGLQAEYYDGSDFQQLLRRRIDRQINFDWGFSGPAGLTDHFSARWTGFVMIPADGTYEFLVKSDDGARLWINDKLIINNWSTHPEGTDRASALLQKGPASIRLDYFDFTRNAVLQLTWRPDGASDARPIPIENLIPSERDLRQ